MGLQKIYTNPENGVSVEYWAAKTATEFDYHSGVARIWAYGWTNQTAADARHGYAAEKDWFVSGDKFNEYFADSVLQEAGKSPASQVYAYLKTETEFFADAVDVV